jgi:hypothetical protein
VISSVASTSLVEETGGSTRSSGRDVIVILRLSGGVSLG